MRSQWAFGLDQVRGGAKVGTWRRRGFSAKEIDWAADGRCWKGLTTVDVKRDGRRMVEGDGNEIVHERNTIQSQASRRSIVNNNPGSRPTVLVAETVRHCWFLQGGAAILVSPPTKCSYGLPFQHLQLRAGLRKEEEKKQATIALLNDPSFSHVLQSIL